MKDQLAALLAFVALLVAPAAGAPTAAQLAKRGNPTVLIPSPSSTIVGSSDLLLSTESFTGIPFAQPPTGQLRLRPPARLTLPLGTVDATQTAPSCPQMYFSTSNDSFLTEVLGDLADTPFVQDLSDDTEDCLTLDIYRPAGTVAGDNLPVLFWIFGGGFEFGSTSTYNANGLVSTAAAMGKPYVFVAVNYRVGGFGFMPGAEILADGAANLGLLDQRMGLEWVADNIAAFGGDPAQVTIWGESAGSISVLDQMVLYGGDNTYDGRPLFRGAIMDSGSIVPADPVDCPKGQVVYDTVVATAGCSGAGDTLACLRALDYETFLNAANSVPGILSYSSIALSYLPRPDGTALPASPDVLVRNGQYAAVPMIIGDQEDEGTIFALFQGNISTEAEVVAYLADYFFNDAAPDELAGLVATYNNSAADGSPFNTGDADEIYPQFKQLAALLGDLTFTLSRRVFLGVATQLNPAVPAWSYLASYDYGTPILGTFHSSDLLQLFYGVQLDYPSGTLQAYYANFVYNLDPNDASGGTAGLLGADSAVAMAWPQWAAGQQLMQFFATDAVLLPDNFRSESYDYIVSIVDSLHI